MTPAAARAGVALIESSDCPRHLLPLYDEPLRPQFHFSQRSGWNNDVNGTVFHEGQWHLFYQYCPVSLRHADKYWGHAVSRDLIHWEELPAALYPRTQAKGQCFSGSAVVDHQNTAGFQVGDRPPIVAVFSDFGAGVGEALAYSNDRGRTFTYYAGNPVLKHPGNDPRVTWYKYGRHDRPLSDKADKLRGHWVMAVYDSTRGFDKNTAFYASTDLKHWAEQSHLPGYSECPELIELPVDGDKHNTRWVTFAADAQYAVGRFDGRTFTPEHAGKHRVHYGAYFASQTFSNPPDGRCIQIGWARLNLPGMPFNQAFTLPHRLTLRTTPEGIRMFACPVEEVNGLHDGPPQAISAKTATAEAPVTLAVDGQLCDILVAIKKGDAKKVSLIFGREAVTYDFATERLDKTPLRLVDGRLKLRVLVDRPMFEVVANEGHIYCTAPRQPAALGTVSIKAEGGGVAVESLEVYKMKSIWKEQALQRGVR